MKIHQNYITLMVAVGFALLVLLANIFYKAPDSILRMGFAIALYLISRDTLASASIAQGKRSVTNPARWILAFYLALFFGTFMLLATWRGMEHMPNTLVGVAVGATLYGGLMAFLFAEKPYPYAHHFEVEKPMLLGHFGLFLYYIAPPLKLAAIFFFVTNSPPTLSYLFFYTILIGFAFPRYRRKSKGNLLWANFPTLIGYLGLTTLIALHL